jgi:hypothetical protein
MYVLFFLFLFLFPSLPFPSLSLKALPLDGRLNLGFVSLFPKQHGCALALAFPSQIVF